MQGLIAARQSKRLLSFHDSAPVLSQGFVSGSRILIVAEENSHDTANVSIANYAAAINADVIVVPEVQRKELISLSRRLEAWSRDHSSTAFNDIRRKITDRIRGIEFSKYEAVTFFTTGLPYGLVIENVIPA